MYLGGCVSARFHSATSAAGARWVWVLTQQFQVWPHPRGGNRDNTEPPQLPSSRNLSDQPYEKHHINVCIVHSQCAHPLSFLLNIPNSVAARLYQKVLGKLVAFKCIKITFESEANAIPVISATLDICSQAPRCSMAPRDHWESQQAGR